MWSRYVAVCQLPLKFEWLRQGFAYDVETCERRPRTPVELLGAGLAARDRIPESSDVSQWVYQCVARCPGTGEKKASRPVVIEVSKFLAGEASLPTFKIALVICQEEYRSEEDFPRLHAPRNDGSLLVKKLEEMDFAVLSFVNLEADEMRGAIDLFASLINSGRSISI